MIRALVILLLAIPALAGKQTLRGHVPEAVARLQASGRLPGFARLDLAIGLPLRDREGLTNLLEQLYDPASPQYRQYLSPAQFAERFGPTEQDYQRVIAFFESNGFRVVARHPNRVVLDINGSVADVEKTLHLAMRIYPHPREPRNFHAPDAEPSLDLTVPIASIAGLDNYTLPRPAGLKAKPLSAATSPSPCAGSGPQGSYQGNDFRASYAPGVALDGTGQVVGLLEFDGYYASDILAYESQAGLRNVTLTNVLLNGFSGNPGADNLEVALDIEMVISMAPGVSKVIVYEGASADTILSQMATDNQAKQISSSWSWSPVDSTAQSVFWQFAAQGQSFFNASGDTGAYSSGALIPPADNLYVTSVGGTTLTTGPGGAYLSEEVWSWGPGTSSGGGISPTYFIPSWQKGIAMTANKGSTTFRNVPDVAFAADNVLAITDNGAWNIVGGTSVAAPLWAGFIALVNQQAVANGRPVAGFINPAIYAIGKGSNYVSCFNDVTVGNNTNGGSPNKFYAVSGYDLCTGWGTPKGSNLINALAPLALIPRLSTPSFSPGVGFQFSISNANGIPISSGQVSNVQVYAASDLALTATNWTRLTNSASLTNGLLQFVDPVGRVLPWRFYRAVNAQ